LDDFGKLQRQFILNTSELCVDYIYNKWFHLVIVSNLVFHLENQPRPLHLIGNIFDTMAAVSIILGKLQRRVDITVCLLTSFSSAA